MSRQRAHPTVTVLPDGRVLAAGGGAGYCLGEQRALQPRRQYPDDGDIVDHQPPLRLGHVTSRRQRPRHQRGHQRRRRQGPRCGAVRALIALLAWRQGRQLGMIGGGRDTTFECIRAGHCDQVAGLPGWLRATP